VTQEVEDRVPLDRPRHGPPEGLEEGVQRPAAAAEGRDVADRAHRHLDQAVGVDERLGRRLRLHNALEDLGPRLLAGFAERVGRVLAADPPEAQVPQQAAHVGPVGEAVREAARRAEAGRVDAHARLQGRARQPDVLADHVARLLPGDQPRRPAEAELEVLRPGGLDVDVVVGVVADRVAGTHDLLEPVDVFLLQHPADEEAVQDAAPRLDAPARLDGVRLGLGVEVALLVVPVGRLPRREVAAHLQVERDGDQRLAGVGRRVVLLGRARGRRPPAAGEAEAGGRAAGEEAPSRRECGVRRHESASRRPGA
jgi:hypothetical protein